MKTVILCGGRGLRLSELTDDIPKPLAKVGEFPILWHIMKIYSAYGFNDFVLALGYLGYKIKDYFLNFPKENLRKGVSVEILDENKIILCDGESNLKIHFVETGEETNTGGRIKKLEKIINEEEFMCTYGDGLAEINIKELVKFHKSQNRIATISIVNPLSQFGILEISNQNIVTEFKEKPRLDHWINGGFFVFNRKIFDYLTDDSVLEKEPFENLAKERQISAFKLNSFWKCMDTFKDNLVLNDLWKNNKAEWKVWK